MHQEFFLSGGGAGAEYGFDGASAVQTHMTNGSYGLTDVRAGDSVTVETRSGSGFGASA